jgi:hypothetical protein
MRWILLALALLALMIGGAFAWRLAGQADVAAAAMAKVACSCVFVAGRDLDACRADDPPGFERVTVVINPAAKAATARAFTAVRRAIYSEAYGCTLEP